MQKILFIEGIYPINTRSQRIIKTLEKICTVRIVAWNRKKLPFEEKYIFSSNEGYGNKLKKLLGIYSYFKYVRKIFNVENPEIVFVSQWDMLIIGFFLKSKGIKLIYDNIDMPASKNIIIWNILRFLERILLKKCDIMIYASRFFVKNYIFFNKKTILLENLPLKSTYKLEHTFKSNNKIKLAFVGTIRYYDILKKSVDIISKVNNFEYHFYGTGPDEDRLKKYCEQLQYRNIYFHGGYDYSNISEIYNSIDILWAAYPNKDYNVRYAISNKFYESLIYEKPTFFSSETKLGELIFEHKIGFKIDPYNPSTFFNSFNFKLFKEKMKEIELNIKKYKKRKKLFWEEHEEEFIKFIEKELK